MANKIMSDGQSDGLVMFYNKGGTLYPIIITKSEWDILNEAVPMALERPIKLVNTPMGQLQMISKIVNTPKEGEPN